VVIPVRNNCRLLNYVLQGWAQSDLTATTHEIIVVDDGSEEFDFRLPRGLQVTVVRSTHPHGAAHARNLGASRAKHEYIFFCDADHVIPPDVISRHEEARGARSRNAIVVGAVLGRRAVGFVDPQQLRPAILRRIFDFAHFQAGLLDKFARGVLQRSAIEVVRPQCPDIYRALCRFSFSDHALSAWGDVLLAHGSNLLGFHHTWLKVGAQSLSISKRSFLKIGGFDEAMLSMEDWELGARLQETHCPIVCVPEAEPLHLVHPRDSQRDKNNASAALRLVSKHPELVGALFDDSAARNLPGRNLIEDLAPIRRKAKSKKNSQRMEQPCLGRSRAVCLTFDDGPDQAGTPAILEVLHKHSAKATFFILGEKVQTYADLCRKLIAEGHEIGLHGWTHHPMTQMSLRDIRKSLTSSLRVVEE
jgi:GT2 family glycosyltransferase